MWLLPLCFHLGNKQRRNNKESYALDGPVSVGMTMVLTY